MDHPTGIEAGMLLAVLVGVWVMIDATKRGIGGIGAFVWGLGTFLLLCLVLPLWLFLRPSVLSAFEPGRRFVGRSVTPAKFRSPFRRRGPGWEETDPSRCPACGGRITPEDRICPSCGIHFGLSGEELLSQHD